MSELQETEPGIPRMLAYIEEAIFDGLPKPKAVFWPKRFLAAIPAGKDLSLIGPRFLVAYIERHRASLDGDGERILGPHIDRVLNLLRDWINTGRLDATAAFDAAQAVETSWEAWGPNLQVNNAVPALVAGRSLRWAAGGVAWESYPVSLRWIVDDAAEFQWMADKLLEIMEGQ
jgi:hypothetical protein